MSKDTLTEINERAKAVLASLGNNCPAVTEVLLQEILNLSEPKSQGESNVQNQNVFPISPSKANVHSLRLRSVSSGRQKQMESRKHF